MDEKKVTATFHPQAWINGYAVDVDPKGDVKFDVTPIIEKIGKDDALKLRDNSYESDHLALSDCAPQWIRDWGGPFYVEVEQSVLGYFSNGST